MYGDVMEIPEEKGESGFTIPAVAITILLSVFIALISTYIALKISALPWPIVFSVVVSLTLLKIFRKGKTTVHEINVAQAGGTIGGLISAGIVFVIPAIIYINQYFGTNMRVPSLFELIIIAVFAGFLGVVLSMPIRRVLIDEENLPFPSGLAGAEVIKAGDEKGLKGLVLLNAALISVIYALLSSLQLPPILKATVVIGGFVLVFTMYPIMLAFGSGYILGLTAAVISWVLGAFIGWAIILPIFAHYNPLSLTPSQNTDLYSLYVVMIQELGIGFVLGSGFAFLVFYALPGAKKVFRPFMKIGWGEKWYLQLQIPVTVLGFVALIAIGLHPVNAVIAVIGAWFMAIVAGKMTGETNIDPLEQFGLFVGLLALFFGSSLGITDNLYEAILVTSFVAIAAAVAGDIGHDFKGAQYLGTKPIDIVKADLIAVITGGTAAPAAFMFLYNVNKTDFFQVFSAVQSKIVAGALFGLKFPMIFFIGFVLGVIIEGVNRWYLATRGKTTFLNGMTFGIGLFLGWLLAIPFFIGAIIRGIVEKRAPDLRELGLVAAAGIMAGEGFIFYITPLFQIYTTSTAEYTSWLLSFTFSLVVISIFLVVSTTSRYIGYKSGESIGYGIIFALIAGASWLAGLAVFTFVVFGLIVLWTIYISVAKRKQ